MKTIAILLIVGIVTTLGLGAYLSPDDLAGCESAPSSGQVTCQPADAIIAISGGDTTARAQEAIKLFQAGWAPKLIFSGAAEDKSGPSNAKVMRQAALEAGIAPSAIIIEEYSETTKQNAEKTQTIFEQQDISSVILVTSAYHQRRAGLEFSKRSADVVVRNHPVQTDNQWTKTWWLTTTGWYLATTEFFKVVAFYAGGTR